MTVRALGRFLFYVVVLAAALSGTGAWAGPTFGQRAVSFAYFAQDGKELLIGIQDMSGECSEVIGIDFTSGRTLWRAPGMLTSAVTAISRDGSRLAISYAGEKTVGVTPFVVLDTRSGQLVSRLHDDRANGLVLTGGDATSIVLSPDGKEVYAALRNGWLAAWDADTGQSLFTQNPPKNSGIDSLGSLAISADGRLLAWSREQGVYLLALPPEHSGGGATIATVRGHIPGRDLYPMAFSPDGHTLAIAQGAVPGNTLLWSLAPLRAQLAISGCGGEIAWSADSRSLACQTNDAVQLVGLSAQRRALERKPRTALETPLTPVISGADLLLYQEQSPHTNTPAPLVFSSFGTGTTKTITLQP